MTSRTFNSNTGENFWQKRPSDNTTIELITNTGTTNVFIKKNLTVANTITVTSSENCKEYIKDINNDVDDILKLNSKEYNYKNDPTKHFGFIAEEVENIYPNLISTHNEYGKSLNYLEILPLLLNKIKDLQQQINELKNDKQ